MRAIAEILRDVAPKRIHIEGHADAVGPALANLDLSRRRARAVEADLRRRLGANTPRVRVTPFGEATPVAPNIHPDGSDDRAGRMLNRRVVIVLRLPADASGPRARAAFRSCRFGP
jgi:outer membrane protein OmpA-like peptidoglycan-associated protein